MHMLLPLLLSGILAALVVVLVRPIAIFESTFLTSGSTTSQTLVVGLYIHTVFESGVRAVQSIDAMAVVYLVTALVWCGFQRKAARHSDLIAATIPT
jgi:putative spermidine/putrescine transport system permease protein